MPNYMLNENDVRTINDVRDRVLGKRSSGTVSRHRPEYDEPLPSSGADVCSVQTAPSAGYGTASVKNIDAASDGTWSATGDASSAIALQI